MNFKKILVASIAAVMMITSFAGCTANEKDDKKNTNGASTHEHDHDHTHAPDINNDVETDFTVTVGTVSGKPGETVKIPIEIKENPGVCAFYITMTYDEKLDLISHKDGGVLGSPIHGGNLDYNPYNLTWDDSLEENSNNGVITTLEFKIAEDAKVGDKLEVSVKPMFDGDGAIFDYDLVDVPINCVAGGVNVVTAE